VKILITGGNGYLAQHLLPQLTFAEKVFLFDEAPSVFFHEASYVQGSILDIQYVYEVIRRNQIDCVIHLAAKKNARESVLNPDLYFSVNTKATLDLAQIASKLGVKLFLFASSAAVYGNTFSSELIDELTPLNPLSPYGESKKSAEIQLQDFAVSSEMKVVSLRLFNLAGYKNSTYQEKFLQNLFPIVANCIKTNESVKVYGRNLHTFDGSCVRDYVHVYDAAKAFADIAKNYGFFDTSYECFNVSTGIGISVLQVIREFEIVSNKKIVIDFFPEILGEPISSIGNSQSIFQKYNWAPVFGIQEMVSSTWVKLKDQLY
jgi:UDP-glucose 4-epimerase